MGIKGIWKFFFGLFLTIFFPTLTPLLAWVEDSGKGALELSISSGKSNLGKIRCALWTSKKNFLKNEEAFAQTESPLRKSSGSCFFSVPPGKYAAAIYHDENANGKLDTNFLGIPIEGIGFSQNAKGFLGPPSFEETQFVYNGGPLVLQIELKYL